ncbi:TIGR04190 family B12-binding domain/radical SAM domain protein [Thiomonas sp. FB-Cd]|uniref:TIGR04190 family B12-binding domain/radical SAM domain protein n=1 Tax=Thiomonas sp. FB-Cd TaxID=1158292 RepID=UPI001E35606E|nr:TIGR04190 family B12-binding domain/radical SAM domain protein [Thiomonas sp. FB-Cd]
MDLLLLHAPSVYDFRKHAILYGPVSDLIPSSTVFEMYPLGFLTIASYLRRQGMEVRIVNLALRMINSRRFSVPRFLAKIAKPAAIGIDLHWLPHCHGALEVARIAKEILPDTPIIMGGLSSSYFHEELITYPQVDYVLRGDSTEPPLHQLLLALRDGSDLTTIPNLTWKKAGAVQVNPYTFIPATLDYADLRPDLMVEMVLRYRDLQSVTPFNGWTKNPITTVFTVKGCAHDCVTCGSSHTTCTHLTMRDKPVFRSPASLVENMQAISRLTRAPIFLVGDLLQAGPMHAAEVLEQLRLARINNEIVFEFFTVPPTSVLQAIARSTKNWSMEFSPESHDRAVRNAQGGGEGEYDNTAMESFFQEALRQGCHRIDVFFMIGLPQQTVRSVHETIDYCEHLFALGDARLSCFISPMGPFLDPGSRGFEEPERLGYRLFARTLEEHRQLLIQPTWERILNYETRWMSRTELVDVTYAAAERLNDLKVRHGRISPRRGRKVASQIKEARALRARLDAELATGKASSAYQSLAGEISRFSMDTVCDKRELFWPRHAVNFKAKEIVRIIKRYLSGQIESPNA